MTRKEMIDNYAQSMEAERINLGLSQAEMAKELELSVSTYKRIISGESNKVDIYTLYLLCNLTNKFAFEIMGGDAPFLDTASILFLASNFSFSVNPWEATVDTAL